MNKILDESINEFVNIDLINQYADSFINFFEDHFYIMDKLQGLQVIPAVKRMNVISLQVRYKIFDIYIYEDTINMYINSVSDCKLKELNVLNVLNEILLVNCKISKSNDGYYTVSMHNIPVIYINDIKNLFLHLL